MPDTTRGATTRKQLTMTEPSTTQRDDLTPNLVTVTLSPDSEDRTVYLPATDQCNEMVRDLAAAYGDLSTTTSADVRAAAAFLDAGYRKPTILGYVVVGRDGGMVTGSSYSTREEAQAKADEWTVGAKTNQIDWEYRVAEIVEATP